MASSNADTGILAWKPLSASTYAIVTTRYSPIDDMNQIEQVKDNPLCVLEVGQIVLLHESNGVWLKGRVYQDFIANPFESLACIIPACSHLSKTFVLDIVESESNRNPFSGDSSDSAIVGEGSATRRSYSAFLSHVGLALHDWASCLSALLAKGSFKLYRAVLHEIKSLLETRLVLAAIWSNRSRTSKIVKNIVTTVHSGNKVLGFDDLVFDPASGVLLSHKSCRAVELLALHSSFSKITNNIVFEHNEAIEIRYPDVSSIYPQPHSSMDAETRYNLWFEFKSCLASVCLPGETAEFIFSVYDYTERKVLCEEFSVILTADKVVVDDAECLSVLFSNIDKNKAYHRLYLICKIVRKGSYATIGRSLDMKLERQPSKLNLMNSLKPRKRVNTVTTDSDSALLPTVRRPFGFSFLLLTDLFKSMAEEKKIHCLPQTMSVLIPLNEVDFSSYTFLEQFESFEALPASQAIKINLGMFSMDSKTSHEYYPLLKSVRTFAQSIEYMESQVTASHSSVFLTLVGGSFQSMRVSASKGIQITVECRIAKAKNDVKVILLDCSRFAPNNCFESVVYRNLNIVSWNETLRLQLSSEELANAHIFFSFRICSLSDYEPREVYAFSFLPLTKSRDAVIPDGLHTLTVYKYDESVCDPSIYLNYPSGPNIFVPLQLSIASPDCLSAAVDAISKLPTLKDTFVVETHLVSNFMTQTQCLVNLFDWRRISTHGNLNAILSDLTQIKRHELHKFLPKILVEIVDLFQATLDERPYLKIDAFQRDALKELVFETLIFVISEGIDSKRTDTSPVASDTMFERFLESLLVSNDAWVVIIQQVESLVKSAANVEKGKQLRKTIKVMSSVIRLVIKQAKLDTNRSHTIECKEKLLDLHSHLCDLVSMSDPDHALAAQTMIIQQFGNIINEFSLLFSETELFDIIAQFIEAVNIFKPKLYAARLAFIKELILLPYFSVSFKKNLIASVVSILYETSPYKSNSLCCDRMMSTKSTNIGETELISLFIPVFEAILMQIQPGSFPIEKITSPFRNNSADLLDNQSTERVLSMIVSMLSSLKAHIPPAARYAKRFTESTMTGKFSPLLLNKDADTFKDFQRLGSCLFAYLHITPAQQIRSILTNLNSSTNTLERRDQLEMYQLILQMLQMLVALFQPGMFDARWLTFSVYQAKMLLQTLEVVYESLVLLPLNSNGKQTSTLSDDVLATSDTSSLYVNEKYDMCWTALFQLSLISIDLPILRNDTHSKQRKDVLKSLAGNIWNECAQVFRLIWFGQGQSRSGHIQDRLKLLPRGFISSLLDFSFNSHRQIQSMSVDIIYSILYSEFLSTGKFERVNQSIYKRLHSAIEAGVTNTGEKSDLYFVKTLRGKFAFESDQAFIEYTQTFLDQLSSFTKLITSYHQTPERDIDERVSIIITLLRLLKTIGLDGYFLKYQYRLYDLHVKENNLVEAAITLKSHIDLLEWSQETVLEPKHEYGFHDWQTEFERKEELMLKCIQLLGSGHALERAAELCSELADVYKYHVWDNNSLADILRYQALLYHKMANEERCYPSYYRVVFYGKGFANRLRGKQFIYKGHEWEKLSEFSERILKQYPNAHILNRNGAVDSEVEEADGQYLQIAAVQAVPDVRKWKLHQDSKLHSGIFDVICWDIHPRPKEETSLSQFPLWLFEGELFNHRNSKYEENNHEYNEKLDLVPESLSVYYKHNEVSIFSFSRPVKRTVPQIANHISKEFLELWTETAVLLTENSFPCMSRRSPVCDSFTYELSPIENAIIAVRAKTKQLDGFEQKYRRIFTQQHNSSSIPVLSNSGSRPRASFDSTESSASFPSSQSSPVRNNQSYISGTSNDDQVQVHSYLNINLFTMALNGAVDAPVNGGIPMYKSAFLDFNIQGLEYLTPKLRSRLRQSILEHVEMIHGCLALHEKLVPVEMRPLHDEIVKLFEKNFSEEIEELRLGSVQKRSTTLISDRRRSSHLNNLSVSSPSLKPFRRARKTTSNLFEKLTRISTSSSNTSIPHTSSPSRAHLANDIASSKSRISSGGSFDKMGLVTNLFNNSNASSTLTVVPPNRKQSFHESKRFSFFSANEGKY